jgi:hypothetical protein
LKSVTLNRLTWALLVPGLLGGLGALPLIGQETVGQETTGERPIARPAPTDSLPQVAVSDAERSAVAITSSDLDLHLIPAAVREEVHANLTLVNRSATPLTRIPLQISGSLRWLGATAQGPGGATALTFTQSPIATDADHTGYAQEAILTPAKPLAPGASLAVSVFYAGEIKQSSARLELLGADPSRTAQAEWDAIVPTSDAGSTSLRGFGDVLWYPVAAPVAALGDGNKLFELIASERRRNAAATMRLRLTVEYVGDPPDSAIFDGHVQPLDRRPDMDVTLVDETHGVATADFAMEPLGYRSPSLFLTAQHATVTEGQLLSVITPVPELLEPYAAAAKSVQGLLASWLGPTPAVPLTILDHPGAPFEDGAFLAAHLSSSAQPEAIAPELVLGLTHAWMRVDGAANAWLDAGLAEFMGLLWTEKTQGRAAALAALGRSAVPLALTEPDFSGKTPGAGQPLTDAYSDIYLRVKSASVLWQLRDLLGEEKFQQALIAYRRSLALNPGLAKDREGFQRSIEKTSGKDLGWFFNDWVYRDRGLPDLSIVQVNARAQLTSKSQIDGYLVAIEVKNDGDAVADVPVTVRSSKSSIKERVRVGPHALGSVRIFFQGVPETVEVNDWSVPEVGSSVHKAAVTL